MMIILFYLSEQKYRVGKFFGLYSLKGTNISRNYLLFLLGITSLTTHHDINYLKIPHSSPQYFNFIEPLPPPRIWYTELKMKGKEKSNYLLTRLKGDLYFFCEWRIGFEPFLHECLWACWVQNFQLILRTHKKEKVQVWRRMKSSIEIPEEQWYCLVLALSYVFILCCLVFVRLPFCHGEIVRVISTICWMTPWTYIYLCHWFSQEQFSRATLGITPQRTHDCWGESKARNIIFFNKYSYFVPPVLFIIWNRICIAGMLRMAFLFTVFLCLSLQLLSA